MTQTWTTFADFATARFGAGWYVGRQRPRYGEIKVSPAPYRQAQVDWLQQHGRHAGLDRAVAHAPGSMTLDEIAQLCGWTPPAASA